MRPNWNETVYREALLAMAAAADVLNQGSIDTYGMGLCGSTFHRDMTEALSGDPLVVFTVTDVLNAIHNWSVMAVKAKVTT